MPFGDMTGPLGEGPYTGRRGGNLPPSIRFGRGWGGRGRGRGRGRRGVYFLFGQGGKGRGGRGIGFGNFRNVGF